MSGENPWKSLGSRLVYENAWMRIREDRVVRPDGNEGIYGVVETRVATGVVALTDVDEVILVGQWRYPFGTYSWEIPEGGTDDGEAPLAAAKRELEEEAGVVAEHWEQLGGEFHLSNCISSEVGVVFLARGLTKTKSSPDPTELLEVKTLPFDEVLRMVDEGEITDSVTIVAMLRAARATTSRTRSPKTPSRD
jgi:8-oxo-dGTP pyrophosphatase MutT (NUDIX family)